jgi:hypothetical protein
MVWLWQSFDEFKEWVQPVVLDRPGAFNHARLQTWFEAQGDLHRSFDELQEKSGELRRLIFAGAGDERLVEDPAILGSAHRLLIDICHAGETILLYHKRLAISRAAYGFINQHDILEHWERYSSTKRIYRELAQLTEDTDELLTGYRTLSEVDDSFLVGELELPADLAADFKTARDLFSVGFDEAGVLLAGRGLEGVLRRVALTRKLSVRSKGKDSPAYEADLHDLIELAYRIQWKTSGQRLISAETRALLHYLRTLRNGGAHATAGERAPTFNPRETAMLVASVAGHLWSKVSSTRARFISTAVERNW